jgi:hypothetical protein
MPWPLEVLTAVVAFILATEIICRVSERWGRG